MGPEAVGKASAFLSYNNNNKKKAGHTEMLFSLENCPVNENTV